MIKLKTKIESIKESNLVFFIEKISDLKALKELKINKEITENIKKTVEKNKNKVVDYFI
ncbi:MAG: hypothetical protein P1U46_01195 [Patescibacteria group bacterium]|nr:hypothetical protein [Patescibacteria group bacterium]